MDSKHRHELEQNDLATFITHFGQWWSKWGHVTLLSVLLVVAAFTAVRFYHVQVETAKETAWRGLAQSTSPDVYRSVALSNENPVRALAYLRGADLLVQKAAIPTLSQPIEKTDQATKTDDATIKTEATTKPSKGESKASALVALASKPEQDPAVMLDNAKLMYQAVVDDKTVPQVIRLNAMLGLGAVAEAKKQWNEAGSLYQQVVDEAGDVYTQLALNAQDRQARIARLKMPVRFAKVSMVPKVALPDMPVEKVAPKLNLANPLKQPATKASP